MPFLVFATVASACTRSGSVTPTPAILTNALPTGVAAELTTVIDENRRLDRPNGCWNRPHEGGAP